MHADAKEGFFSLPALLSSHHRMYVLCMYCRSTFFFFPIKFGSPILALVFVTFIHRVLYFILLPCLRRPPVLPRSLNLIYFRLNILSLKSSCAIHPFLSLSLKNFDLCFAIPGFRRPTVVNSSHSFTLYDTKTWNFCYDRITITLHLYIGTVPKSFFCASASTILQGPDRIRTARSGFSR